MYRSRTVLLTVQRFEFSWLKYSCSRAIYSKAIPVRKTIFKVYFSPPRFRFRILRRCSHVVRSSQHFYTQLHTMSISPRGPAWRGLRFGRDVKMLAGYHPQETPHFNRDTTVTFQDTTVVSIDICSGSCIEIISPPPAQSIHDIVSLVAEPNWASVRFRQ